MADQIGNINSTTQVVEQADVGAANGVAPLNADALLDASDAAIPKIGTPTYTTLELLNNALESAGVISGGDVTDNGDGTVDIALGTGLIRSTDSTTGAIFSFDWTQSLAVAIQDGTSRHIGVEYNAGFPQITVRTTQNWNFNTDFDLAMVTREGLKIHVTPHKRFTNDFDTRLTSRIHGILHVSRDELGGGLILGETGTRNVTLTTGSIWVMLQKFPVTAKNTSAADTFDTYYATAPSTFTKGSGVTQWPNTQYNDGSTLITMTNNRYANLWWYVDGDDELVMMFGSNEYVSFSGAETEQPPSASNLPLRLKNHSLIIGRFIFQKSAATTEDIQSVFTQVFTGSSTTVGLLSDLSDVNPDFVSATAVIDDDGKIPYYDVNAGAYITSENVTHGTVVINAKKSTAGTIAKGLPVYLVGFDADLHTVEIAEADVAAKMPVIGFSATTLDDTNNNHVVVFGKLAGVNTTNAVTTLNPNGETWAINDSLYMSLTSGGLTKNRPIGNSGTGIQRIAKVLKIDATGGQLFIFNTARTAGLPNIAEGKVWRGDANSHPIEVDLPLDNLAGTTAPTANEDSGDGYSVGSIWIDTTNDKSYTCVDSTVTAAVWFQTSNEWTPGALPIGAALSSGASAFLNGGAGFYWSFSGSADDLIVLNVSLEHSGIAYDGGNLALILEWRINASGVGGDTVGWIVDYGFIKDGDDSTTTVTNIAQQDVDVSTKIIDQKFETQLGTMTGVSTASTLMLTLTRNATGAGADVFSGNAEIIGMKLIKV